jgi:hypothetical protein
MVMKRIMPNFGFRIRRVEGAARNMWAVLFLVLMSSLWCYSADMVLIRSAGVSSSEQNELELAAQFYGLNLKVVTVSADNSVPELTPVEQSETVAVAIEANVLGAVDEKALLRALHRRPGGSAPLLIFDVTPDTDPTLLNEWSNGAAVGPNRLASPGLNYVVGDAAGITEQLTGLEIPFPGNDTFYFASAEHGRSQEIMSVRSDHQVVPVFIEAELNQQKVFLLCKKGLPHSPAERSVENTETAFAEIAPVMIFSKYGAGGRGWHAPHHYANLTIDDPWLREPYGHLVYKDLLQEMEKHNFHTTIAFIPWNYDRSEGSVVALFRSHPERFSICVHGDNHDHKEFDDFGSKPLRLQIAAVKQSLARMDRFQTLTGIPYDDVFVFPHNIGSESILEELKTYNFIASVNSLNVPMDRTRPSSPLFPLRPVTLAFGDFPSVARYGAAMPKPSSFIGINDFLDNPVFFYGHHDLFASGIGAFDGVADEVNKIQPDTRWRSLGEVAKHLYLLRLRADSNYDVLAFSSSLELDNNSERNSVFYIQKQEIDSPAIASLSVDGQQVPFQLDRGFLHLSVAIPAGESRNVVIRYRNDLDLASISISKSSLRVYLLRTVSDFRDITLSKYSVGRSFTDYYYKDKLSPLMVAVCSFAVIVLGICGTCSLLLILKRKKAVGVSTEMSSSHRTASATRDSCTRS